MPSLRRWVTSAFLTMGLLTSSAFGQQPGQPGFGPNQFGPAYGPGYFPPGMNAGYRPGPGLPIAPVRPLGIGPAVVLPPGAGQQEMLLMQQMAMHAKNLGDEISAVNEIIASQNGARFVIDPRVVGNLMQNPYINTLVRTTLSGTPPRTPRPPDFSLPAWRPQTIEYMVTWRAIDVFFAANDWVHTPRPEIMQAMANRFSIMVPDVYFYIEAMRETYLINPLMQWPNADLPIILARMEGQVFVMRQLMDALYCNPFFRPLFPSGWGNIEATFYGFRMDVRTGGPLSIAPFPFYAEGFGNLGLVTPAFPLTARPNVQPILGTYDPQLWNGVQHNDLGYIDRTPIQGGVEVPGLGDPNAFQQPQIPNIGTPGIGNYRVGLPQLQPPGGGQPGISQTVPQQAIPQQGIPLQGQGQPGFDQQYGLGDQQLQLPQDQVQGEQYGPQQVQPGQFQPQQQQPNMPQQQQPQQGLPLTDNASTADGVVWGNIDYQPPANQQQQQPQGRR